MSKPGAAIIGTGFMAWVHVEALRRINIPVVGILGSNSAKTRSAAEQLDVGRAYEDLDQLLNDDAVSVVHIATPNRLHFDMASRSLSAGKHVMCEKPLAMNSTETAELVKLAAANPHLCAAVNYNIRFYALCRQAAAMAKRGDLGDVVHVTGSYVQDWLTEPTDYNWRLLGNVGGELRAVSDIGTHWIDLVYSITGLEIDEVCADLKTVHEIRQRPAGEVQTFSGATSDAVSQATEPVEIDTEDYGAILLRFRNGSRGCLHVSQVTPGRKNCLRFEIAGSERSLAWNSEQPNELWVGHRNAANEMLLRDPALLDGVSAVDYPGGHNEGYPDSFKYSFRAFYDFVQQNDFELAAPFASFADGHREVMVCEAILTSHRERRWVKVPAD